MKDRINVLVVADNEKSHIFVNNIFVGIGSKYEEGNPYLVYGKEVISLAQNFPQFSNISNDMYIAVFKNRSGRLPD